MSYLQDARLEKAGYKNFFNRRSCRLVRTSGLIRANFRRSPENRIDAKKGGAAAAPPKLAVKF